MNNLIVTPTTLYITYNTFDGTTTGQNYTEVQATYGTALPPDNQDTFTTSTDPALAIAGDDETYFGVFINPLSPPTVNGVYNYIVYVTGVNSGITRQVNVVLTVLYSDATPEEEYIYKLKYYIQRNNHRLEIKELVSPYLNLIPIEINGKIEYNYQNKDDLFTPIVASNLKLRLESSLDLSLNDLYSEEERTFKADLYIDNNLSFTGFIKPDGIYADWVFDRWDLDIECYDGLSTLKNISFVTLSGVAFSGRKSVLEIIYNCLLKTGLDLPININCELYYDSFQGNNILESIYVNTERYYQDANKPMDCESVLNSLLQIFNASIVQYRGAWWIYRPIDLKENTTFDVYNGLLYQGQVNLPVLVNFGSQINGADIFHCGANQRESIAASVQAYRVTYEYGAANSVFSNGELRLDGAGLNIPGWTVNNPDGDVFRNEDGYGLDSISHWFSGTPTALLYLNQTVNIIAGSVFKLTIYFTNTGVLKLAPPSESSKGLTFSVGVGGNWLKDDGTWSTTTERIFINNSNEISESPFNAFIGKGFATYEGNIRSPYSGNLEIIIWRDQHEVGGGHFKIHAITLSGSTESDIKGREFTAQRKKRISTVTKSNQTVYNGDSVSDLIIGTIFKLDADTATRYWYREGQDELKELLEINAEDNLRISPRPMTLFEGDIYGYVPFISLITIDGFEDKQFQFLEYSFNVSDNTIRMQVKEFENEYLTSNDFLVNITNNYGNETKVVISS